METEEKTQPLAAIDRSGWPQARADWRADPVAARLEVIVGRSRRQRRLRRALRRLGDALARRLDALVPPAPRTGDAEPPPEIRFPFF
jgi:hypothetical protein